VCPGKIYLPTTYAAGFLVRCAADSVTAPASEGKAYLSRGMSVVRRFIVFAAYSHLRWQKFGHCYFVLHVYVLRCLGADLT
jgi:hypothetical protein